MGRLVLYRDKNQDPKVTLGRLSYYDDLNREIFRIHSLELPWKDNKVSISCIPPGEYTLLHRTSQKFGKHIHVTNVPGRSWILIHPANFVSQLRGCIAPGLSRMDLNDDQILDVTNSRNAMEMILKHVKNLDKLIVK